MNNKIYTFNDKNYKTEAAQKRAITIYNKKVKKEVKQTIYASSEKASKKQATDFTKKLLNAGETYNIEKNKGFVINKQEIIRERKKKGKGEALGMFKVVSYYDNLYYEQMVGQNMSIIMPNIPIIKQLIDTELRRQISSNNSKHKLSGRG